MTSTPQTIDVRTVPPPQRHALIFGTFDALSNGQSFELLNDHDPIPLFFQFDQTRPGQYDWRYLESGPERWRVRIARRAEAGASDCGGGSGGGCRCSGG
ncbi:MAG: DUF2249 domain-containing protein [Rubrivivax sp.]